MPNLVPPVRNVAAATAYRERILAARPENSEWQPLMVLYLTDNTSADDIRAAHACAFVHACKYYPAGATTNSDSGVTDLERLDEVFETMQELGVVLQMHGEVTDPDIDIRPRSGVYRSPSGSHQGKISGTKDGSRAHHYRAGCHFCAQ